MPFGHITCPASHYQIGHPVAAPTATRCHVVHLQRDAAGRTVRAPVLPLGQQELAHFHPPQRPTLVLDALHVWVLQQLSIKAHQLVGDGSNRAPTRESLDPGQHVLHPRAQRGGQPALMSPAIAPARLPVARVALPTRTPGAPPLLLFLPPPVPPTLSS